MILHNSNLLVFLSTSNTLMPSNCPITLKIEINKPGPRRREEPRRRVFISMESMENLEMKT